MTQVTLTGFFKDNPITAIGSITLPTLLIFFVLYEQHLAENATPHLIGISQSFTAIVLSALALILSFATAMIGHKKVFSLAAFVKFSIGLGIGALYSLVAIAIFLNGSL